MATGVNDGGCRVMLHAAAAAAARVCTADMN